MASYPTHRCCGWPWCSRPRTLLVHYIQCKPPPLALPVSDYHPAAQQQGHWVICERRVPCPCPEQRSGEINHWVPAAATTGPARSRVSASHAWAPTCRDFVVGFVSPGGRVSAGGGCIGLRHPLLVPHHRRTLLDHVTSLQVLRTTSIGKTCRPIMQDLYIGRGSRRLLWPHYTRPVASEPATTTRGCDSGSVVCPAPWAGYETSCLKISADSRIADKPHCH